MGGFRTLCRHAMGEEKFCRSQESNPDCLFHSLVTILTNLFRLSMFNYSLFERKVVAMKKYLMYSYMNELHTSSSGFNIFARTSPRRTWSFIPRGQFRRNHRSHRKQNVMVIDRPQPWRDGLAVLKILRPEGNVSLWGQRNATFGTDIFSRIYEAYKKVHRTKITQFLPRVPGVVKCISCEHVSQNVFWILKTVACIS